MINDCIALLNLSVKRRTRIKNQKRQELQRRLLKGYSHKIPSQDVKTKNNKDKDKDKEAAQDEDSSSTKEENKETTKPAEKSN